MANCAVAANKGLPVLEGLRQGLAGSEIAVIHSSLPRVCREPLRRKWDFLHAVRTLAEEGKTLAFPAFTYDFCRGEPYHWRTSRSQAGVFGDWVLELNGAVRSPHPIYSFALLGPLAGQILDCANSTTFGPDSSFARFEQLGARIVMLGCGWDYCTQFHCYDEEAAVPYRYYKTFTGTADFGNGAAAAEARMYVRDLELDCLPDFSDVMAVLAARGQVARFSFLDGALESVACRDIAAACREMLQADPWALVASRARKAYAWQCSQRAATQPALKVALLGSANLHLLSQSLKQIAGEYLPDRRLEVFTAPFGDALRQAVAADSDLQRFQADVSIFLDRPEDLLGVANSDALDWEKLSEKVKLYGHCIREYRQNSPGWIFVHSLGRLQPQIVGIPAAEAGAWDALAESLASGIRDLPQLKVFDLGSAAAAFDGGAVHDPRLWHLGHFPFSEEFSRYLARRYTGMLLAALGRTTRLLLVDLDNTLWGGILGEDGISGLKVGGDYPGNAFLAFQTALKKLSERGVALAICSKNDADHALEAMRSLPAMRLRPEDFVACRINWESKARNAVDICNELGLGTESALLIDDNPAEREQMRLACPAIKVLELPPDPALYCRALADSPWLECISLTSEDLHRVKSYRAKKEIAGLKAAISGETQFLAALQTRLHFRRLDDYNLARTLQLLAKTNQFNTTSRRYNHSDLERILRNQGEVFVIGMEDKFTQLENIGVLILRWDHPEPGWGTVDSYLLSCRVLGRGLETGVLYWLMNMAGGRGIRGLVGEIVPTERNFPARNVYREAGFVQEPGSGQWRMELPARVSRVPEWLTIVDGAHA